MILNGFNANEHESQSFEPLPVGDYLCVIVASEEKQNSKGTGSYLKMELEVIGDAGKGRKLWVNLNLNNPNPDAVRIAQGELSSICKAVGVLSPKDSCELHNIPLLVKVGLETRKDTGEVQNRVKGYKTRPGIGEAAAGSVMPAKVAKADNTAAAPPPWSRKA